MIPYTSVVIKTRHWELQREIVDLLLEGSDPLPHLIIGRAQGEEVLEFLGGGSTFGKSDDLRRPVDQLGRKHELWLLELTGCEGRSAHPESSRRDGALVAWHTVLVDGDATRVADVFQTRSIETTGTKVHQDKVVVRPT